jgi:hypothetical protein
MARRGTSIARHAACQDTAWFEMTSRRRLPAAPADAGILVAFDSLISDASIIASRRLLARRNGPDCHSRGVLRTRFNQHGRVAVLFGRRCAAIVQGPLPLRQARARLSLPGASPIVVATDTRFRAKRA